MSPGPGGGGVGRGSGASGKAEFMSPGPGGGGVGRGRGASGKAEFMSPGPSSRHTLPGSSTHQAQPHPAATSRAKQPVRGSSYGKQALAISVNLLRSPPVRSRSVQRRRGKPAGKAKGKGRASSLGRKGSASASVSLSEWQARPGGIALAFSGGSRSAPGSASKPKGRRDAAPPRAPATTGPSRRTTRHRSTATVPAPPLPPPASSQAILQALLRSPVLGGAGVPAQMRSHSSATTARGK